MTDLTEHFSQRARRILLLAQEEAVRRHHRQVDTEHLLLALLAEKKGFAAQSLAALGCDFDAIRRRVDERVPQGDARGGRKPKLADSTKAVIKAAVKIANEMGHRYIGSEHLLLALLDDENGLGNQVLQEFVNKADVVARLTEGLTGVLRTVDLLSEYLYFAKRVEDVAVTNLSMLPATHINVWREQQRLQIYEAAVQEERSRLARDLHDAVKQQLFSINLSAAAIRERIDQDRAGALTALADVQQGAQAALAEINALLRQLSPVPLATAGLLEALREQCEALGYRTGATVTHRFGLLPAADQVPLGAQETLFRIVQEAFSNIARHARAATVNLQLEFVADEALVRLEIHDDGQGFDPQQKIGSMGLLNMKNRTEQLNGQLTIHSAPGAGTQLRVDIPHLDAIRQQQTNEQPNDEQPNDEQPSEE